LESIRLILKDDAVLVELAKTRFGGLPAVPEGAEFSKPMDFGGRGRLRVSLHVQGWERQARVAVLRG
jgi:hypothetical protein